MPITYGNYTKQLKLLPLVLYPDGSASVTVRFGFVGESGDFQATTEKTVNCTPEQVSAILDTGPIEGMTRRDDLSFAVYQWLVESGNLEAGQIS